MKRKGSFYLAIFFGLLGLFGIVQSLTFRYWEAMTLPLTLSSLIFVTAIIEVAKELRNKPTRPVKIEAISVPHKEETDIGSVYRLLGWVVSFIACIWIFGFLIAIPLFAFSYLKWRNRSWLVSVTFAVSSIAIIFLAFEVALKTELYRGLIFGG